MIIIGEIFFAKLYANLISLYRSAQITRTLLHSHYRASSGRIFSEDLRARLREVFMGILGNYMAKLQGNPSLMEAEGVV